MVVYTHKAVYFFLLGWPMFLHSILIVVWWSSNPIKDAIVLLCSFLLVCYMFYFISPDFIACLSFPTSPSLLPPSPRSHPSLPLPAPLHPLGLSTPATTITEQPRPPDSAPSYLRGPESVASQFIAQPCSASLRCKPRSPQNPPLPSLPPAVDIPSLPHPFSWAVSLLSSLLPHAEIFPGPVPCGVSSPTSPTRKSAPP